MKNSTKTNPKGKRIVLILSLIVALSLICLVGCKTVDPPKSVDKIYSVNLQYDGVNVDGQLSVDLSLKTIRLTAKVLQDGAELPKYESSDESIDVTE